MKKYTKIVHIKSNILSQWLVYYGNLNYFYSFFKHPALPKNYHLNCIYVDGDIFYNDKDIELWRSIVLQNKAEFISFIINIIKDKVKNLEQINRSKKDMLWKLSELIKIGACTAANGLLEGSCHDLIQKIFLKYNLSKKDQLSLLYKSSKETKMMGELKDLQKIINDLKKQVNKFEDINFNNPKIFKLIEEHLEKYAFLGMNYFGGEPLNKNDIIKRIEESWNLEEIKYKETLKYPELNEEDSEILDLVREVIYLRTERNESITHACYLLHRELENKAKELGLTYEDIIFLTLDEIFNFNPNLKTAIEERKKGFAMLIKENHIKILTENELKELEKSIEGIKPITEIKGLTIFPGIVKGKVQIVDEKSDFSLFNRGNILVTKYTTPSFTSLMSRSSAIVTDVGGMTSHAAIVSRELKIPCIVGTDIATKVLKDGDLVEVDADKGIVKKIN